MIGHKKYSSILIIYTLCGQVFLNIILDQQDA